MNGLLFFSLQLKSDFKWHQEEEKYSKTPKAHLQRCESVQPAVSTAALCWRLFAVPLADGHMESAERDF